jgi:uncharacterized cofD-like protein
MLTTRSTRLNRPISARSFALAARAVPQGPRVAAIGGGTGLPVLLRGLKEAMFPEGSSWSMAEDRDRLTAIVTVADDGGSSGRLREAYGVLPPGDLRNCLLALSEGDPRLASLFDFRFRGNGGLGGHSLGNLILTALSEIESDLLHALDWAGTLLSVRGRVLPASLDRITLRASYEDGSFIDGESRIAGVKRRITRIQLCPPDAGALPQAVRAIRDAELIVIGPGSLYTSIIPVLLTDGIASAIGRSAAKVVLVLNLMTEPGETDGYSASEFVSAIHDHAPQVRITDVLINSAEVPGRLIDRYAARSAAPVQVECSRLRFLGCTPVLRDLLEGGEKVRHDPHKLGSAVLDLIEERVECLMRT